MRPSVYAAWPAMCTRFEGRLNHLYLDTKGLVTTGTGNLLDSGTGQPPAACLALSWYRKDGQVASDAEVTVEWLYIKSRTDLAPKSGYAFAAVASLHLDEATLDRLLSETTARFWTVLARSAAAIETFPADAQLVLLDLAWQNGPAFLDLKKTDGSYVWLNTRTAVLAQDWTKAAAAVPGTGERADTRRRLFTAAAKVQAVKADPAVVWDTQAPPVPPAPVPPALPKPPLPPKLAPRPAPAPPKPPPLPKEKIMRSSEWGIEYVRWRNGNVALVTRAVCQSIPSTVYLSQGGLSFAKASGMTHAGIGAYDIDVKGWSRAQIITLCEELIRSGEVAFPRGGWFGTGFFVTHVHVVSANVPRAALHPEARAQIDSFKRGRNGLPARDGRYVGPAVALGSWADSPYNPVNIKPSPGRWEVLANSLQGLNVNRDKRAGALRKKGDLIVASRLVKRWGRWNAVAAGGTFYACKDRQGTYLKHVK